MESLLFSDKQRALEFMKALDGTYNYVWAIQICLLQLVKEKGQGRKKWRSC